MGDDIVHQTHRVMRSVWAILDAAGGSFQDVARMTVLLTDLGDFAAMNVV